MHTFTSFQRPGVSSPIDKGQTPSTVKYLLSFVSRRKSRLFSKEDFAHPSLQARVPNVRHRSVISSVTDEDDFDGKVEERYEIHEQRSRGGGVGVGSRVSPVLRGNKSNNICKMDPEQQKEYVSATEEKFQNYSKQRERSSKNEEHSPSSPASSSSSIRSSNSTNINLQRRIDKIIPDKAVTVYQPQSQQQLQAQQQSQQPQQQTKQQLLQQKYEQSMANNNSQHNLLMTKLNSVSTISIRASQKEEKEKERDRDKKNESKDVKSCVLCCDKCDGKHETDDCPHYKKKREVHIDAQKNGWKLVGGSSTLPGEFELFIRKKIMLK